MEIKPQNKFVIRVKYTEPDRSPDFYLRYFIVTDPVGRILGLRKRIYKDARSLSSLIITNIDELEMKKYLISEKDIGKIADCPFVRIFIEDKKWGCWQSIVWLH